MFSMDDRDACPDTKTTKLDQVRVRTTIRLGVTAVRVRPTSESRIFLSVRVRHLEVSCATCRSYMYS